MTLGWFFDKDNARPMMHEVASKVCLPCSQVASINL